MSGPEQKWKDWGSVSYNGTQVTSDQIFLMNLRARDLKGRSGFTEGWWQYASRLLNTECEDIDVVLILNPSKSSMLHWAVRASWPDCMSNQQSPGNLWLHAAQRSMKDIWQLDYILRLWFLLRPPRLLTSPFSQKEFKVKFSKCFQEKNVVYRGEFLLNSSLWPVPNTTVSLIPIRLYLWVLEILISWFQLQWGLS